MRSYPGIRTSFYIFFLYYCYLCKAFLHRKVKRPLTSEALVKGFGKVLYAFYYPLQEAVSNLSFLCSQRRDMAAAESIMFSLATSSGWPANYDILGHIKCLTSQALHRGNSWRALHTRTPGSGKWCWVNHAFDSTINFGHCALLIWGDRDVVGM